jgi:hypothetical protein
MQTRRAWRAHLDRARRREPNKRPRRPPTSRGSSVLALAHGTPGTCGTAPDRRAATGDGSPLLVHPRAEGAPRARSGGRRGHSTRRHRRRSVRGSGRLRGVAPAERCRPGNASSRGIVAREFTPVRVVAMCRAGGFCPENSWTQGSSLAFQASRRRARICCSQSQRTHRPIMLARDLAAASAGASREIAADLGARLVRAADELARTALHAKSGAVAIDHPHVRPIAIEPNELVGAVAEERVVVTRHADIRLQPRKAASSACETFWNRRQARSTRSILRYRRTRPKRSPPLTTFRGS